MSEKLSAEALERLKVKVAWYVECIVLECKQEVRCTIEWCGDVDEPIELRYEVKEPLDSFQESMTRLYLRHCDTATALRNMVRSKGLKLKLKVTVKL